MYIFLTALAFVSLILSPLCEAAPTSITSIYIQGQTLRVKYEGGGLSAKAFRLKGSAENNQRYVVNFPDAVMRAQTFKGMEQIPGIEARVAQFTREPLVARLVVEGPESILKGFHFRDNVNNEIIIDLGKSFLAKTAELKPEVSRVNDSQQDRARESSSSNPGDAGSDRPLRQKLSSYIELEENDDVAELHIYNGSNKNVTYTVFDLNKPPRLVIDLENWKTPANKTLVNFKGSKFIEDIRTGYPTRDHKTLRLVLDLKQSGISHKSKLSDNGDDKHLTVILTPGKISGAMVAGGDLKGFKVLIDAGHGGYDCGALHSGVQEKGLTLKMADMLEKMLEAEGIAVQQTRKTDTFISLNERVAQTRKFSPDIFVSIHCNALDSLTSVSGIETYYYTPQSLDLANRIHNELISHTGAYDRRVRKARFVVIRETEVPSVLLETGFLSNPSERSKLLNESYQRKLMRAAAEGIYSYLGDRLQSGSSSAKTR